VQDTTGNSIDAAFNFWAAFAKKYATEPAVLYDTWEDMHGIDNDTWSNNQNQLIATIRTYNPQALIFVEDTGTAFEAIVSGSLADFAWSNRHGIFTCLRTIGHLYDSRVAAICQLAAELDRLVSFAAARACRSHHGWAAATIASRITLTSRRTRGQTRWRWRTSTQLSTHAVRTFQRRRPARKVAQAYTAVSGPPAVRRSRWSQMPKAGRR
jgi:hypothetical protein